MITLDEPAGKVSGFSLHAGVSARAHDKDLTVTIQIPVA